MIYENSDNFERLCKEIRKVEIVPAKEQLILFKEYYDSPTKELENKLFNLNLRLVINFINKFNSKHNQKCDMISVGSIGLIKAIRTFNPYAGNAFSSYAKATINNEIYTDFKYNETTVRKKRTVREKIKSGEIVEATYISTSTPLGEDNDTTFGDTLTYNNHFFDNEITEQTRFEKENEFWSYVKSILPSERSYDIVKAVYSANTVQTGVIKMTETEIGAMLGLTKQRIGQLKLKAFEILGNDKRIQQYYKNGFFTNFKDKL